MDKLIPDVFLPLPVWVAFAFILMLPVIWGLISHHCYYSNIRIFGRWNLILSRVLMAVILFMTIASRFVLDLPDAGFDWMPFDKPGLSLMTIGGWENVVNNILLMEPLGMLVVNVKMLEKSNGVAFGLTVLNGLIFSLFIEMVQLAFTWGAFELEDIICNVTGMAIGAASVFITRR